MKKESLFEAIGGIDDHYVREAHTSNAKRKAFVWGKWIAVAASLTIVVFGLSFMNRIANPLPPDDVSTSPPDPVNHIVVNQAGGLVQQDMDARCFYYNDLSPEEKGAFLLTFQENTGINYHDFTAKLPESLMITSFCSLHVRKWQPSLSEYAFHDYILDCRTEKNAEVTIAFSPINTPLQCCIVRTENPTLSQINGVDVEIHGWNNSFNALFHYKGLYYDIETTYFTIEELEELLSSLLLMQLASCHNCLSFAKKKKCLPLFSAQVPLGY